MITGLDLLFIQNIGPTEMLLILVVALLVFGGRLPQVARSLGKSFVEFKKGLRDLNNDLKSEMDAADRPPPPRPAEKLAKPQSSETRAAPATSAAPAASTPAESAPTPQPPNS